MANNLARQATEVDGATERYQLLVEVDDRPGIVAAVAALLARRDALILELDSHTAKAPARPSFRVEFCVPPGSLDESEFAGEFDAQVGRRFQVSSWELLPASGYKATCA